MYPVAVFGSSEPTNGDELYDLALRLGRSLAEAGYPVITGGYGGVMEAASRGAMEAGGHTLGVLCKTFSLREPNRYLAESFTAPDLYERTRALIERSGAFVVLRGKAGTLAELSFLWALHRAGCLDRQPVILLGECWQALVGHLADGGFLDRAQIELTHVARAPEEVIHLLEASAPDREWG